MGVGVRVRVCVWAGDVCIQACVTSHLVDLSPVDEGSAVGVHTARGCCRTLFVLFLLAI